MHCTKCACVKYHETKIVCPLWNVKIRLNFNFHMFSAGAGVFFPEPEFFLPEPEVKNPEFAQHYPPPKDFLTPPIKNMKIRPCSQSISLVFILCISRGRYTTKIYPTFLQLHGKTYDYKIPYTTILRIFLLPHRDNRFVFFVVRNTNCCF